MPLWLPLSFYKIYFIFHNNHAPNIITVNTRGHLVKQKNIPNPHTEYGVIKRYLHVLALLQNNKDPQNWNGTTLADLLSKDETEGPLTDKTVREYISEYLEKDLGIEIDRIKGRRHTELAADLEGEFLVKLASIYASFVIHDSSRDIVIKNFIRKHPLDGLWMMARIYFASLERKRIRFNYTTNSNYKITNALFHPYHLVLRNNNLYLYGKIHGEPSPWLLILNRLTDLKVTEELFDEEPPSIDEVFRDTLGSFIGKKYHVRLRIGDSIIQQVEQFLSILEPKIERVDPATWEARFTMTDDTYLCKQLLLYGKNAEILEPPDLREKMIAMLRESMAVYAGNK